MKNVDPRFWGALALSILFFLYTSVGAQERQVAAPPPHVAECLMTMTAYGNFIMMRRAGITEDDAIVAFNTSVKMTQYMLKQQNKGPISPKVVAMQRGGIYAVYALSEEILGLNEALSAWMNNNMQSCVEANTPSEPEHAPEPDPRNRMIPS